MTRKTPVSRKKSFIVFLIIILFSVSTANANFRELYKIGSYFEFIYSFENTNVRFSARVISDTVINNVKFQELRIFNEPAMGDYSHYYYYDTLSKILYSKMGYTNGCLDSNFTQTVIGMYWPKGYTFNHCFDTLLSYVRCIVSDTGTFSNILNYGFPLRAVQRTDTFGAPVGGSRILAYSEFFGFLSLYQGYGCPFGGGWLSITLVGAIIDSVTYGSILIPVKQISSEVPENFLLKQNYPNPFNSSTTIEFSIPKTTNARLRIYDLSGKDMVLLFDEKKPPGTYKYLYYANNLSSGVYFYRLETDYGIQTKRMILLK